ncbi:MAG: hypothetical protein SGJ15_06535 [Bacteroidota bacterium]|nr:hypothetical protein [Bacteroidota bacterium]
MDERSDILLLTASINPAASKTPLTFVLDPQQRLSEYLQNLEKIIETRVFKKIIFCENTHFEYDYSHIISHAKNNNIILEALVFKGNYEKVEQQGKGYGEGEIIKYAIANSKLLDPDSVFYKLTGRIFVKNINSIVKHNKQKEIIFIRAARKKRIIDARFFKTSVRFFKQNLIDEFEKVDDYKKKYLEMVYFEKLHDQKGVFAFNEFPYFIGTSGSTGKKYDQSAYEYFKYSLLLKFGLLGVN